MDVKGYIISLALHCTVEDKIFVHTVTTHRRNITGKLQIHTPAGLTIYAIVNKLVSINEIKLQ